MNVFFQTFVGVLLGFLLTSGVTYAIRYRILSFLEKEITVAIDEYLQEQIRILLENPEKVAKNLSPLIKAFISEALKDFEKNNKPQSINLFGFKIPAELAQLLIQRFIMKEGEKNINPFS